MPAVLPEVCENFRKRIQQSLFSVLLCVVQQAAGHEDLLLTLGQGTLHLNGCAAGFVFQKELALCHAIFDAGKAKTVILVQGVPTGATVSR